MMSLGHKSLSGGFYDEAIHYFTVASIIKPHSQDAIYYLNLTKRIKEGRIAYLKDLPQSPVKIEAAQTVTETVESQAKDNLEAEVKDLFAVISARKEKRAGEVKDGSNQKLCRLRLRQYLKLNQRQEGYLRQSRQLILGR
jgi:hypothetical protein